MIYSFPLIFLLVFFCQDCIKEFIHFLLEDLYHLHMFGFKVIFCTSARFKYSGLVLVEELESSEGIVT